MIDIETWKFINSFAPWFSAAGTISAVILSLWLASRNTTEKLKVKAVITLLVQQGSRQKAPEYLMLTVTNVGHIDVKVTNIGWELIGFKPKQYLQIIDDNVYSDTIPVDVKPGDQVKWLVELNENDNWIEKFYKDVLAQHFRVNLFRLRFIVYTSRGKVFKVKIDKTLQDAFIELHEKKTKERNK